MQWGKYKVQSVQALENKDNIYAVCNATNSKGKERFALAGGQCAYSDEYGM